MEIRKEQLAVFEQAATQNFIERAIAYLREHHRQATASFSAAALRRLVEGSVPRAKAAGLETEREVICFAVVSLLLGPNFLDDPAHLWAGQLLKRTAWTAEQRAKNLLETGCLLHERSAVKQ